MPRRWLRGGAWRRRGQGRLERPGARGRLLTRLVLIGMALLLAAYIAPLFL
ncbi:hypothetical protein [Phenylobacterium sp. SCN 70-31]|uniref:hypothetical protein n=1 Tax=Phenylobacterium sp. SCN 70-31 TaxID=1660129 RepID=UPI0025D14168|nr:hypothetical protein [Phenylobacterium sp. SCN 70-31]